MKGPFPHTVLGEPRRAASRPKGVLRDVAARPGFKAQPCGGVRPVGDLPAERQFRPGAERLQPEVKQTPQCRFKAALFRGAVGLSGLFGPHAPDRPHVDAGQGAALGPEAEEKRGQAHALFVPERTPRLLLAPEDEGVDRFEASQTGHEPRLKEAFRLRPNPARCAREPLRHRAPGQKDGEHVRVPERLVAQRETHPRHRVAVAQEKRRRVDRGDRQERRQRRERRVNWVTGRVALGGGGRAGARHGGEQSVGLKGCRDRRGGKPPPFEMGKADRTEERGGSAGESG